MREALRVPETAEAWARGEVTIAEVNAAAYAAFAAAAASAAAYADAREHWRKVFAAEIENPFTEETK